HNGTCARLIGRRLAPALAMVQIDIEHVDLVVCGDQRAVGPEQEGAVGHLPAFERDSRGAQMHEKRKLPSEFARAPHQRIVRLRIYALGQLFAPAHENTGHLRALHIGSTLARGLPNQSLERREIRSEEHTSELQSRENLVCRLLLEKKKKAN